MTDEERQLIQTLADHVKNAPAPQVDRDADTLIRQTIGARPDALYILTQTVLIQEMALNQAKQQIEQLKQQAPAQPPANFLPSNPAPQQSSGYRSGGYQGSSYRSDYAPPPPPPPPPQAQYIQDPQPSGGRFSGFLHNAAQTAAGVVAGEVAFSALSSIFGGHGGGGGGFFGGGGYGVSPGSETIINNYYDDDRGRGGGGGFGNDRSLSDSGLSPDLEDRRFAGSDSGDDQQADDQQQDDAQQDDVQQDDSDVSDDNSDDSSDDGSSYDDGSGSDDV
jgi:hypothetical protein